MKYPGRAFLLGYKSRIIFTLGKLFFFFNLRMAFSVFSNEPCSQ